ncbi:MAG: hypothetical protein JO301_00240 [Chitinophagaceae bacterium]|nr:hypothetical protein [Chitinophagaceae bacterium]
MSEQRAVHIIHQLQRNWNRRLLLARVLLALASAILISSAGIFLFRMNAWWSLPILLIAMAVTMALREKISVKDIIIHLDTNIAGLEESSSLLLQDEQQMNLLQKLQVRKIAEAIDEHPQPATIRARLNAAAGFVAIAIILSVLLAWLAPASGVMGPFETANNPSLVHKPEIKPAGIDRLSLILTPPAYTGRKQRQQDRFNLSIEEGGHLFWNITTTPGVHSLQLLFNDGSILPLRSTDQQHWMAGKLIDKPGFYQVKLDTVLSELYQVEMIKDQQPVITVQSPKPNTLIEPWMRSESQVKLALSDDYGIRQSFIAATVASGSGEAVKFKQQQLSFPGFAAGGTQYQLQKLIDLKALGMKRGDELYFYITASDNHGQEKHSDMYIVRIEDTAQLMSVEGLASGLDIKPEFFRSQRQIIIETEQLLREKDTISVSEFNRRSNNLGIDQKLLRLRYSKFLGEEESEGAHDDAGGFTSAEDFNNAEKILDEVTHKHDIAEDASFFDPQTKKQLKATLSEMWKSELQLRVMKPKEALPFEYTALRLLKDLQQQSRVYVAKTGVKTAPLKPEKRLTGELDKIDAPVLQQDYQPDNSSLAIRKALGALELVKSREDLSQRSIADLEQASIQLSQRAAAEPGIYLRAFESLRHILQRNFTASDIETAGHGLQRMLNNVSRAPARWQRSADNELSQRYFQQLNPGNE